MDRKHDVLSPNTIPLPHLILTVTAVLPDLQDIYAVSKGS